MHLAKHDPAYSNTKLNEDSLIFYEKLNKLAGGLFTIKGWGCRGAFQGDYHLFFQEMAKAKVLFGPSIFINFENFKLLDDVLQFAEIAIDNIRSGKSRFLGKMPTGAFSTKLRKD